MTVKIRTIKYYISDAFKSLFRNRIMSITSMLTVASCILILIFSICVIVNVDSILNRLENNVGVTVFIDNDFTSEQVKELDDRLMSLENVIKTDFISSEDALESMASEAVEKEQGDIIRGLKDKRPIKRSFSLTLENSRKQSETIATLTAWKEEGNSGIYKIVHAKDTIEVLISLNNIVRTISTLIVIVLGLLSIIIIMNTIKLTVNNRRHDIGIMKYVGATDWFIKWPFIIEGVLIGIFGSLIPIGASVIAYGNITKYLIGETDFASKLIVFKTTGDMFSLLAPSMLILGVAIGALGSLISMRKYLDV